jgi:hypothetical protein
VHASKTTFPKFQQTQIKDNISNKPKKEEKDNIFFFHLKKERKSKDIMDSDSWSTCPFCDLPVPSYQLQRYVV